MTRSNVSVQPSQLPPVSLAPEVKAFDATPADALDSVNRHFEAFKDENDTRQSLAEKGRSVDVLVEEKLARMTQALDEAQSRLDSALRQQRRPMLDGAEHDATSPQHRQYKSAFHDYMRSG